MVNNECFEFSVLKCNLGMIYSLHCTVSMLETSSVFSQSDLESNDVFDISERSITTRMFKKLFELFAFYSIHSRYVGMKQYFFFIFNIELRLL